MKKINTNDNCTITHRHTQISHYSKADVLLQRFKLTVGGHMIIINLDSGPDLLPGGGGFRGGRGPLCFWLRVMPLSDVLLRKRLQQLQMFHLVSAWISPLFLLHSLLHSVSAFCPCGWTSQIVVLKYSRPVFLLVIQPDTQSDL